jgi:molybdopterin-binding protein
MRGADRGSDLNHPPMNFSLHEGPFSQKRSSPQGFQVDSPQQVLNLRERRMSIDLSVGVIREGKETMPSESVKSQERMLNPREAAHKLGISYSTMKRWIYKQTINSVKTAGGHYRVPETELDRFLHRAGAGTAGREHPGKFREADGRNQLIGRVTDIKIVGLMAQVTVSIGEQSITSVMNADAVRDMDLQKGSTVAALIVSTSVMISRI